mgnify:CR=1 FL=1
MYDVQYYKSLFERYGGMMRTSQLAEENVFCLKWFWNDVAGRGNYGFVFYDKTPGGAGHVRRMQNPKVLERVLRESLNTISGCTCGGAEMDTSCYSCLRNYYNQKHHELLQRRYVIEYLSVIFS